MKIADETLDALFDMDLPLPRPVVRSLAEGIDTILQKCPAALTPTCPQTNMTGVRCRPSWVMGPTQSLTGSEDTIVRGRLLLRVEHDSMGRHES